MTKPYATLLGIAICGMLAGIVGSIADGVPWQKWCFLASAVLMTPLAVFRKDEMLMAIQMVSLVGALVGLMDDPATGWLALPVVVALAVGIWLKAGDHIDDKCEWLGVLGTAALALGYATQMAAINVVAGLLLTTYMAAAVRTGQSIAWLWLSLNVVFVATSVISVLSK